MIDSLAKFLTMYAAGELIHDQTYRNYDLDHYNTPNHISKALNALGFHTSEYIINLTTCQNQLAAYGLEPNYSVPALQALAKRIGEWYRWHQINTGVLRRWKYRPHKRGPNVPKVLPQK